MKQLRVETLHDEHDCETCGPSYATGYEFFLDDKSILRLEPHAHCFEGSDYDDQSKWLEALLTALGHDIQVDWRYE